MGSYEKEAYELDAANRKNQYEQEIKAYKPSKQFKKAQTKQEMIGKKL